MKRLSLLGFLGLLAAGLYGCPIFDDGGPYHCDGSNCGSGGSAGMCTTPSDCGVNETCGKDGQCHSGDCTFWGCPSDYTCVVHDSGRAFCDQGSSSSSSDGGSTPGTTNSGGAGGSGGAAVVWCGNPADCGSGETCAPDGTCHTGDCTTNGCIFGYTCDGSSGVCSPSDASACAVDTDCASAGSGYACVDGHCTAPADQCFDQNQCSGKKCAGGKCETACSTDADCPSTNACDTHTGVCSKPAKHCTITNDCGDTGDEVCVGGGCYPRATEGACTDGSVEVENGCIPGQGATFTCTTDGQQDACASGSICVHHSCYIACGADPTVCNGLPTFNQCQAITSSSGAYNVCGSPDSLGSDCDPTQAQGCGGGKICVDGVCK
ncbi:MAG TPA: hypothetical protein VHB21_25405 [Minicystis sp.]|nr:hypothetical protein [Minicystis sp.]